MTLNELVLRGSTAAFSVRVLAAIAGLGMNVALARMLSLSDYGILALGLSWLMIVGTIACFGVDALTVRLVANGLAKGEHEIVSATLAWGKRIVLRLGLFVVLASSLLIIVVFSDFSPEKRTALCLVVSTAPLLAYLRVSASALRAYRRFLLGAIVEMLMRPLAILISSIILFNLLSPNFGLVQAALAIVVAQLIAATITWYLRKKHVVAKLPKSIGRGSAPVALSVVVPIAITGSMTILLGNLDTIFLGYYIGESSAGVYRASNQLAVLASFLLTATNTVVAPLIAELYGSRKIRELQHILRYSVTLTAIGAGVSVLALFAVGDDLLSLFGEGYTVGYPVILLLVLGQVVNALSGPTSVVMTMTGYQKEVMYIIAISTVFYVLVSLVAIPRYGILGAAAANVFCLSISNMSMLLFIRRNLGFDPSILSWLFDFGFRTTK